MMIYATFSNGYRSGGFNGRVGNLIEAIEPYDPETVDNYEIGLKSELMDNRLRFNANVFFMDYDDKQEELQLPDNNDTGQKTVVTNASTAEIKGVEIDIQAYLYEGLTLRANLGFLDTSYDEFGYTALDGSLVDLSNLDFRRAPDWTGTIDATFEKEIPHGTAWARLAYHYIGSNYVNVTNAPELENESQNLIDFSVNVALDNGVTLSLFGRNLTDEDGYTHGYDVAGLWSYASIRPPRTYGAEIAYTFGK
jgi:iron complex outermembrane receptor protein